MQAISGRILLVAVLLAASLSSQGCVYLVIGSVGALGGYVVSPDTVEGTTERDYGEVWDAAFEVVNIMGKIIKQNEKEGRLEAIVNNSRVNVTINQLSRSMITISVKARMSFFPSVSTAQDVYIKIINRLGQ